jgi:peptidoglycan hydrolase-like protein with peptidoglycan-binding domain
LHSAGKLAAVIGNHPREFVGFAMGTIAVFTIVTNALFLQKGPHPAPIFAARPLLQHEATLAPRVPMSQPGPVTETAPQARLQLVANIQRELGRKSYYDGPADGIWGAKTDAAVRDFVQATGVKLNPEASDGLLRAISTSPARTPAGSATPNRTPAGSATLNPPPADPIAKLIAPSTRITAVQRALADFGYGQIKPSGVFDPDTRAAIEKFERDHQLPVTGQISDRIVRELAAMTGRPLE